ncbi:MAG: zf-HC2 domain-containing protein [Pyrinomonadaceae bacterium]|nr:zf-HC2 domain-containing protein [Pyrinomonadaceae bacterium]
MNCENLQFDLSLYLDDTLSGSERASIDEHLPTCPLCRQKLAEYRELKNGLRMISNPGIPAERLGTVRNAVASEIRKPAIQIGSAPEPGIRERIEHWFMPYTIGTVAASVFVLLLFTTIFSTKSASDLIALSDNGKSRSDAFMANSNADKVREEFSLQPTTAEYSSVSIDGDAPKVNPAGALLALTNSIVRGKTENEEVVVVADVFDDGLARIADVVEPPSDKQAMTELEKAFQTDPEQAPFLPPKMQKDKTMVRVVLKFHLVEVVDQNPIRRRN